MRMRRSLVRQEIACRFAELSAIASLLLIGGFAVSFAVTVGFRVLCAMRVSVSMLMFSLFVLLVAMRFIVAIVCKSESAILERVQSDRCA